MGLVRPPLGELRAGHRLGRQLAILKTLAWRDKQQDPEQVREHGHDAAIKYLATDSPEVEGILQHFASSSPNLKMIRQELTLRLQAAIDGQSSECVEVGYTRTQKQIFKALPVIFRELCENA